LSARAFWGLASWVLPLGVVFVVSPKLLHLLGAEQALDVEVARSDLRRFWRRRKPLASWLA